nr:hypothetical protein CFP56_53291 [Quercus suber]
MDLHQRREVTGKKKFGNIKTYGKQEINEMLEAARFEKANTIEFDDQIWTLETLASYVLEHSFGEESKEQHHEKQIQASESAACSIVDDRGLMAEGGSKIKRKATSSINDTSSKKVKGRVESKPESRNQLSFDEQLEFDDETAFSSYTKTIVQRKQDAKKKHQSELRKAYVKRKEEAAAAAAADMKAKTLTDPDTTVAEDHSCGQLLKEVVEVRDVAVEGLAANKIATHSNDRDGATPAEDETLVVMPAAAEKGRRTDSISSSLFSTTFGSKFWSGRSDDFTEEQKDKIKSIKFHHLNETTLD